MNQPHTQDTLEALTFRDLQQVVKSFGLAAQGNRDDLTARVLEAQAEGVTPDFSEPEVPADNSNAPADATVAADSMIPFRVIAPAEEADDIPEVPADEPTKAETPTTEVRVVSGAAKRAAGQMVAGYITAEAYTKDVEQSVLDALAVGKQPCIVKGEGNVKFALQIFDKIFVRADLTSDIPPKRDGVVLNVSRRLSDANLLSYS